MNGAFYADARDHRGVHAHLTGQIQGLAQKVSQGETTFTKPVLHFLEDWMLCHIQDEDMDLARHLKAVGH